MTFHSYGEQVKFPRDEHVDIHVRKVVLDPEGPRQVECVEIREWIKAGEVYGHGIVIPSANAKELASALDRLGLLSRPSVGAGS